MHLCPSLFIFVTLRKQSNYATYLQGTKISFTKTPWWPKDLFPLNEANKVMNVQHITYEDARGGRSTSKTKTTTKKWKNYLSSRVSGHSEDLKLLLSHESAGAERPVTMWPRADIAPSDNLPEMTAYLTQQMRIEKAARKEENMIVGANSSGRYVPLKDADRKKTDKESSACLPPVLRRKPKFTGLVKESLGAQKEKHKSRGRTDVDPREFQDLRAAMRDGRLERGVPPVPARAEGLLLPPNCLAQDPFLDPKSTRTLRSKKSSSTSSRVASYMGTSADYMDETRRELAGRFRPPFEHLNYPSFSLSHRNPASKRKGSADSTQSFFCIGEGDSGKTSPEPTRRLSGEGTSPWDPAPLQACRLCRNNWARGIRGLCEDCEKDFMRPKTVKFDSSSGSSYSHDDEFKPTPPLKDKKTFSINRKEVPSKCVFHTGADERGERPKLPLKDIPLKSGLRLASANFRPIVVEPQRQDSQKAKVEGVEGDNDRYTNWQTRSMKFEYDRAQKAFARWSACYENGDFDSFEEDELAPLIGRRTLLAKDSFKRHSSFYKFWDEILNDRGSETLPR
jgi:hypothetical protein